MRAWPASSAAADQPDERGPVVAVVAVVAIGRLVIGATPANGRLEIRSNRGRPILSPALGRDCGARAGRGELKAAGRVASRLSISCCIDLCACVCVCALLVCARACVRAANYPDSRGPSLKTTASVAARDKIGPAKPDARPPSAAPRDGAPVGVIYALLSAPRRIAGPHCLTGRQMSERRSNASGPRRPVVSHRWHAAANNRNKSRSCRARERPARASWHASAARDKAKEALLRVEPFVRPPARLQSCACGPK